MDDFDKRSEYDIEDEKLTEEEQVIEPDLIAMYEKEARSRKKSVAADVLTFQAIICIALISCFLLLNLIKSDWAVQIKEIYLEHIHTNGEEMRGITDFVQDIYKTLTDTRPLQNSDGMGGAVNTSQYSVMEINLDLKQQLSSLELVVPVTGLITSSFGERVHPITGEDDFHKGVDIAADEGTPIVAVYDGEVITAKNDAKAGNYIEILHDSGIVSRYMHCDALIAVIGDKVFAGQVIATIGSTGQSTGPHLHLELQINGIPIDPASLLALDTND